MTPDMPAAGEFTPESLEAAFDQALGDRPTGVGQAAFLARVLEDFRPGELAGITPADVGCVLASFWRFAEERREAAPPAPPLTPTARPPPSGGRACRSGRWARGRPRGTSLSCAG